MADATISSTRTERPLTTLVRDEPRQAARGAIARMPPLPVTARRLLLVAVVAAVLAAPMLGFNGISAPATAALVAVLICAWMARDRAPLLSGACAALAAVVSLPATLIVAWLLLRPGASRRSILVGYVGAAAALVLGLMAMGAVDMRVLTSALIERQTQPGSLPGLVQSTRASGVVPQIAILALGLSMLLLAIALRKNDRMSYGMVALAGAVASPLVPVPALVMAIGALALWDREPVKTVEDEPLLDPRAWDQQGAPVGSRRPIESMGAEAAPDSRAMQAGPAMAQIAVDTQ